MNRKIYKALAKKYGKTVEEIKRDMQAAIDFAYEQPNQKAQAIKRKGEIPTVDEFVSHAASELREERAAEAAYKRLDDLVDEPLEQMIMNVLATMGNTIFKDTAARTEFKNKSVAELSEYHLGLGMYLRNNILKVGSPLHGKFMEQGIKHPDDMSTVIIRTWHRNLQD